MLTVDGKEALRVTISKKRHKLELSVDGKLVDAVDKAVQSKRLPGLSVKASSLQGRSIGESVPAETAEIEAPGLAFAIETAGAKKYNSDAARTRWYAA